MSLRFGVLRLLSAGKPQNIGAISRNIYGDQDVTPRTAALIYSLRSDGWNIYKGPMGYILTENQMQLVERAKQVYPDGPPPFGSPEHLKLLIKTHRAAGRAKKNRGGGGGPVKHFPDGFALI